MKLIREGRASCGEGGVGVKAPQAGLCLLAGERSRRQAVPESREYQGKQNERRSG